MQPNYSEQVGGEAGAAVAREGRPRRVEAGFATGRAPFVESTCFVIESAIDARAAAAIVDAAERVGFRTSGRDYPPSYRDNFRLVHDDAALARALFERLGSLLPPRLVDLQGATWELVGLNERFRLCRYEDGQSFRIHRDGAHAPSADLRSHLTLQIYLDDEFTGGRTRFYEARSGKEIGATRPRRGRAIVFDHRLWHDGEPVSEGVKHVLRADVMYRRRALAESKSDPNVVRAHGGYVFALTTLSDGSIMSGSRDRTVRRFAEHAGVWHQTHRHEEHEASVHALVEATPGVVWSGARDRTIRALDLATNATRKIASLDGAVLSLAKVSERVIAAGCADSRIHLLDVDAADRRHRVIAGHQGWVWAVLGMPGTTAELDLVVSGSEDGTVRVHRLDGSFVASASPKRGPVHALARIEDRRIAAGFADGHVIFYQLDSKRGVLDALDVLHAQNGEIYGLAFENGVLLTAGEDEHARVFRLEGRGGSAVFAHDDFVRSVVWLPEGRFATASYDGTIRFFSLP